MPHRSRDNRGKCEQDLSGSSGHTELRGTNRVKQPERACYKEPASVGMSSRDCPYQYPGGFPICLEETVEGSNYEQSGEFVREAAHCSSRLQSGWRRALAGCDDTPASGRINSRI